MGDDYGRAAGAPSRFTFNGVDYRVAKQGPRTFGELQQFLKSFAPDPRLKAREIIAGLPDAVALAIWREYSEEAKDWPLSLESREGNLILTTTPEGAFAVVWTLLRRHNASLTEEKARELADELTMDQIQELIDLSMPEPTFDPKSPTPATTTGTTAEDRGPA